MLKPSEFTVGDMANTTGLALSLSRASYEYDALVFSQNDQRLALVLTDRNGALHRVVELDERSDLLGVLVANVSIEVDETSLYDVNGYYPPAGSLIRKGTVLAVHSSFVGSRMLGHGGSFTMLSDLPPCENNQSACFLKWQIVLGEGEDKRILKKIEVASNQPG